jgi:hypothetical protein
MRLLILAAALSFAALPAHAQDKDEAGARAAVNHYLAGHATKAMLYWNRDGAFAERTLADSSPLPRPASQPRTRRNASARSKASISPAMSAWPRSCSIIRAYALWTISRW